MFLSFLLSIILFFFCAYLYFNNKKLKQKITELELEIKKILERKIINNKEDLISVKKISIEPDYQEKESKPIKKTTPKKTTPTKTNIQKRSNKEKYTAKINQPEQTPKILKPTTPILKETTSNSNNPPKTTIKKTTTSTRTYQKNNYSKTKTTSPVSMSQTFDPNEFIKKERRAVSNIKKNNSTKEYLEELKDQLANELAPKTIELTDYEKIQEEQAVISYQELLSLKDKIQMHDDEEDNFIEDLKEFRKLLD